MANNRHPPGNMAIAVNATAEGCHNLAESIAARRVLE